MFTLLFCIANFICNRKLEEKTEKDTSVLKGFEKTA